MSTTSRFSPIGIDAVAIAVPAAYLELSDLADARGVPAGKYVDGLGTCRMAVAAAHEDPVALAANAARRVLEKSGRQPSEVGMCVVGTETAVDHSKPIAAYLHGLLGLPERCRVFETKHACFGGTAGLLGATEWIASGAGKGRVALIVCTDVARYGLRTAGEPTQGAGAVAMIVSERPRLVELEVGRSGSFARDVHDFWRPLDRKEAVVDGHYSVSCYLDALAGAYQAYRQQLAADGAAEPELARTCYHVPYGKMAKKAHRHRLAQDGISEAEADARFKAEVAPSLELPSVVGNIYTGSLYLALASLLELQATELEGQHIGLFSYGSGCAAEFFAGRVVPGAAAQVAALEITRPLTDRRRIGVAEYETIRHADAGADRAPVGSLDEMSAPNGIAFRGVEGERRVYSN
jgi:hydroxymethylglutaryl-CoA synthase